MKIFYADPGLRQNLGHHANSCRLIRTELQRLGYEVIVISSNRITHELRSELFALPLFRVSSYKFTDGDPISGWLNSFDKTTRLTVEDLNGVPIARDDILYLNSAQPAQFMALITWFKALDEADRPHVVLEFGTDPGLDFKSNKKPGTYIASLRDYRKDPRPMFYRFAASRLSKKDLARFHLMTFDESSSRVYSELLEKPVAVLPFLQNAPNLARSRAGHRPITVSVLGHQRRDKGYHMMPEIARKLLDQEPEIRLLIHNGAAKNDGAKKMRLVQSELRKLQATDSRLSLNEESAGPELWEKLLNDSDLILCPYDPIRFFASYSAVATEAVANAIPLVVPASTSLASLLRRFGNPGVTFNAPVPDEIVRATRQALSSFDALAARADKAAKRWSQTMGAGKTAEALIACTHKKNWAAGLVRQKLEKLMRPPITWDI